jgi:hypothetical protein
MPSNVLYPSGSENLLKGNFHFCSYSGGTASSSYAALISSSYTYSAAHEFYSEISAHSCSAAVALGGVTCATGTLDAAASTFSSVPTGQTVQHLVVFQSSSAASTDWLLAHFDTGSSGGINITTNGGDITITWNESGILALSGGC